MGERGGAYRLGVDVGGTFTDLLLTEEASGRSFTAKVPSTPADSAVGVLAGIDRVCRVAGIDPSRITHVMHGTTVATNTVLTGGGARVALITTKGYRHVLQIARSYVPGGLGAWVVWSKPEPLAPLELTIEADERIGAAGDVVHPLDEAALRQGLETLRSKGFDALTVALVNAFANDRHERRVREVAAELYPDLPISISSEVMPEMYEYERTETTVVNSYVRPVVARYLTSLKCQLDAKMAGVQLHVLRSDGGLCRADLGAAAPVNLLMSGPAGGVSGALWVARQAGFENLLTFDMGGTSTDVALIQGGRPQKRRETRVGAVTVRAPSIDVRTVGAGGGSIAYVPELTKALRVGPQSAGAVPGPAAYGAGGDQPTVTDANVLLGYLPATTRLGGDMLLDRDAAAAAVQKVADGLGLPLLESAEGIIDIVNESMFGALRLVSVEQGYDPRDFALVAFGGAGPLHANALARLLGTWPVIVPPAPGVLCALGDAATVLQNEASRTFVRRLVDTTDEEVLGVLEELTAEAATALDAEGVPRGDQSVLVELDLRYHGQGTRLTVDLPLPELEATGLAEVRGRFDRLHEQLFTFALDAPHEIVNLRAVVTGKELTIALPELAAGTADPPAEAMLDRAPLHIGGEAHDAPIWDRGRLLAGNRIEGPAIVVEMDATTLILPDHTGEVDRHGIILIRPTAAA